MYKIRVQSTAKINQVTHKKSTQFDKKNIGVVPSLAEGGIDKTPKNERIPDKNKKKSDEQIGMRLTTILLRINS